MAKIRHISYRAENVDAMPRLFVDAFGLEMVQKRKDNSIDLSDGSVNIWVLLSPQTGAGEPGSTISAFR